MLGACANERRPKKWRSIENKSAKITEQNTFLFVLVSLLPGGTLCFSSRGILATTPASLLDVAAFAPVAGKRWQDAGGKRGHKVGSLRTLTALNNTAHGSQKGELLLSYGVGLMYCIPQMVARLPGKFSGPNPGTSTLCTV